MKLKEIHYYGHIEDLKIEQYGAQVIIKGSDPYEFGHPEVIEQFDEQNAEIDGLMREVSKLENKNKNLKIENAFLTGEIKRLKATLRI